MSFEGGKFESPAAPPPRSQSNRNVPTHMTAVIMVIGEFAKNIELFLAKPVACLLLWGSLTISNVELFTQPFTDFGL